jgi:hypothetical protein
MAAATAVLSIIPIVASSLRFRLPQPSTSGAAVNPLRGAYPPPGHGPAPLRRQPPLPLPPPPGYHTRDMTILATIFLTVLLVVVVVLLHYAHHQQLGDVR